MLGGFIQLLGDPFRLRVAELAPTLPDGTLEPFDPGAARRAAFDAGLEPLPGFSDPPPRATGWEREWQQ